MCGYFVGLRRVKFYDVVLFAAGVDQQLVVHVALLVVENGA